MIPADSRLKFILKDMVQESRETIDVTVIQKAVAAYFHITLNDLKANRRSRNIIHPRQIAMYLTRKLTSLSLPEIGSAFGGKDHTTVLHSCKKIEKDMIKNISLKETIQKLNTVLIHK